MRSIKLNMENKIPVNIEYKQTPKSIKKIENMCSSKEYAETFPKLVLKIKNYIILKKI